MRSISFLKGSIINNKTNYKKLAESSYSSEPSKNRTGSIRDLNPDEYNHNDNYLVLNNPNIRIICDSCLKDITVVCHIGYQDSDFCVGCFAQQKDAIVPEKYSIRSTLLYSLTDENWLCLDEILLMTAFQKWGFGNWSEVKDFMNFNGTKFTREEIEQHYDQCFLSSEDLNPKINNDLVLSTRVNSAKECNRFKMHVLKPSEPKPLIELKSAEILGDNEKNNKKKETFQNTLGYNPKRKSFYYDLEYDEKAESMLSDLEFKDDDTEEEIELKFQIIEEYNRRYDERLKRYEFTIKYHILDIDYRFAQEFSSNPYQKEAFLLYRPFTRYQNHEENQETMHLIAKSNFLKSLIQGVKICRRKVSPQGRIDTTLEYLKQKEDSIDKLAHPRKIYRLDKNEIIEKIEKINGKNCSNGEDREILNANNEIVLSSFAEILKNDSESNGNCNLKFISPE